MHDGLRMMVLRTTLCLVSLVGMSGFSSAPVSPCGRVAASYAAMNQKVAPVEAVAPFDGVACQVSTRSCSAEDRVTLDAFLGCVDQLPSRGASDESVYRAQFEACAAGAQLSAGCSL